MPTQLHNIDEAFNVIGMHVSEEDGSELLRLHTHLRQPEAGATTGIELQPHGVAFVTFVRQQTASPPLWRLRKTCLLAVKAQRRPDRIRLIARNGPRRVPKPACRRR